MCPKVRFAKRRKSPELKMVTMVQMTLRMQVMTTTITRWIVNWDYQVSRPSPPAGPYLAKYFK